MNASADPTVTVIGLGYVGLPLAVALADHFTTIGYDIDAGRVAELERGHDRTREVPVERLSSSSLKVTCDPEIARGADVYIITAPTPVDSANRPDLRPLLSATETVAGLIDPAVAPIIIFESTVYPGVTEDICGPHIERSAGLVRGRDFFLAYSPERINPGDREHSVERIVKVVSGETPEVLAKVASIYGRITQGGTFAAASIKTAEAAKVIENAQRDINIAFMNEVAQIFGKLGLSTLDVLDAARTKWNFLPFTPGLVGGHCIGVDPYYLSHCALNVGHTPRVVLAGRATNDGMGMWVADTLHSLRRSVAGRVLVLGVTFKPNVPDMRNSRVIDVVNRLSWLGHDVTIHDPLADPAAVEREYGLQLDGSALQRKYDVVLSAVGHRAYCGWAVEDILALAEQAALIADLQGIWRAHDFPAHLSRWTP